MAIERLLTDRLVVEVAGGLTLAAALQATDLTDGRRDLEGLLVDYRTYLSDRMARVAQFRSKHFGVSQRAARFLSRTRGLTDDRGAIAVTAIADARF
jgi:hypothetical protein